MSDKVALVTGANQGLGLALVKGLAVRLGPNDAVYLTARDPAKGAAAAAGLPEMPVSVRVEQLDVTVPESVTGLAERLAARHGGVNIVISNAAARMSKDTPPGSQVGGFVDTNNGGQRRITDAFVPLLRPGGVFLAVASSFGSLSRLPEHLHDRFDVATASLDDIDASLATWVEAVENGTAADEGWPDWINIPSKIAQVAAIRVLARDLAGESRGLLIAAVCPGLVDTAASRPWFEDMSRAQSPDAAAVPIVEIATGAVDRAACYGQLCRLGTTVPWT